MINPKEIAYIGIKVNRINLESTQKENYHITLEYIGNLSYAEKVRKISDIAPLMGMFVHSTIDGMGRYKDENLAYRVKLPTSILRAFKGTIPHITLQVSENGKAVNSCKCDFHDIEILPCSGQVGLFTYKNEFILG